MLDTFVKHGGCCGVFSPYKLQYMRRNYFMTV